MNYNHDKGREKGINNIYRKNKIKYLKCQLAAVETKTTQADYDSNSDSSDPSSHINGRSKKSKYNLLIEGDGTGNYRPVGQTNNKSINGVTYTQCGLATVPRDQYNKTIQNELVSKDII